MQLGDMIAIASSAALVAAFAVLMIRAARRGEQ